MTMVEKLIAAVDSYDEAIHNMPEGDSERVAAARNLIDATTEARKAEAALIDGLKVKVITGAGNVNDHADKKDGNRNRVNYGCITNAAQTLYMLGVNVDIAVWEDSEGFLRVPKVTIDGKTIEYHNGK